MARELSRFDLALMRRKKRTSMRTATGFEIIRLLRSLRFLVNIS